jgi:catechol 2,3-dioxygenase-like lactoylglutathione lyase family enzyme
MKIEYLDHVALWVHDRDQLATFLISHLGMHEIDRTDTFTIVGADARRGKLTLFADETPREPGQLVRVVLRVGDLERALGQLPRDLPVSRPHPSLASFQGPQRLGLGLIEAGGVEFDIDHVVLRVPEPSLTRKRLADFGFALEGERLRAGDAHLLLEQGPPFEGDRSLLNHFGLRVESAAEHIEEARRRGLEIDDIVDAPNTYAVFVFGPDRIRLEYVEHKASFSLV